MNSYINSVKLQFEYYKSLGDKTFTQLTDKDINWRYNEDSNSIAIIVKHLAGNMLSRWTNFFTADGEKEWRRRDSEFENAPNDIESLQKIWNKGWNCLFEIINNITDDDLERIIHIRNQGHTVTEAINRQLCHYAYHVGQIVVIAKQIKGNNWESLSIPKNQSTNYNKEKFKKEKSRKHFTEDL